eukprot:tig00020610_g12071.t1
MSPASAEPAAPAPHALSFSVAGATSEASSYPASNLALPELYRPWRTAAATGEASVELELDEPAYITGVEVGNEASGMIEIQAAVADKAGVEKLEVLLPSSTLASMAQLREKQVPRSMTFEGGRLTRSVASRPTKRLHVRVNQPFSAIKEPIGLTYVRVLGQTAAEMAAWQKRVERGPPYSPEPQPAAEAPKTAAPAPLFRIPSLSGPSSSSSQPAAAPSSSLPSAFLAALAKKSAPAKPDAPAAPGPAPATRPASGSAGKPSTTSFAAAAADRPDARREAEAAAVEARVAAAAAAAAAASAAAAKAAPARGTPKSGAGAAKDPVPSTSAKAPAAGQRKPSPPLAAPKAAPASSTAAGGAAPSGKPRIRRELLGCRFSVTGFDGEERALLRALGLKLGATYNEAWSPYCTHLVAASPGAPGVPEAKRAGCILAHSDWLEDADDTPGGSRATSTPDDFALKKYGEDKLEERALGRKRRLQARVRGTYKRGARDVDD